MYLCDHVIVHAYLLFDLLLSEVWYAGLYDICLVKYVVATAMYFSSGIYMWPCSDEWIMSWINNTSPSVVYIYIYMLLSFVLFVSFNHFNDGLMTARAVTEGVHADDVLSIATSRSKSIIVIF